jgi:hypothetical protein
MLRHVVLCKFPTHPLYLMPELATIPYYFEEFNFEENKQVK